MGKLFDGKLVFTQIPLLLKYLPVTMELAVTAMIASLILGLLLALVKIKKVPVLKQLVSIYISVIRGTPILVQLYVTYFGIPMLLKYINFKCGTNYNVNGVAPIVYAFVALALNESAFNAEIIRASLESVDKGQVEAASALGMNYFQALTRIILPEAIVVALPSLGNAFIGLIKGTSLLVSHEMSFVRNVATRVIFLDGGKILEDGTPREVFGNPKNERVKEFFTKINRMEEPDYSI